MYELYGYQFLCSLCVFDVRPFLLPFVMFASILCYFLCGAVHCSFSTSMNKNWIILNFVNYHYHHSLLVLLSTCNEISSGSKRKGTCSYSFAVHKCSIHRFAWLFRNDQCTAKSDVAEPTQNPIWNATFDFPNVPGEELMDKSIEATLWDYCPDRDSVFLGECPGSAMTAHYFAKYDYFIWILPIGFLVQFISFLNAATFMASRWMHGGAAKGLPGGQTSVVPTWGPTPTARWREDIPFVSPKLSRKWDRPAPPQESRIWAAKIFFRFVQSALKEAKYSKRFYSQFI